jgi:hypothetical protein
MQLTEEQFLTEIKTQAFALHCAAARERWDDVRRLFEKIGMLHSADKDRQREIQTAHVLQIARNNAAGGVEINVGEQ